MSSQQTPQTKNAQQEFQQRFNQLSEQAKGPVRQIISQMQEITLASISQASQNQVILEQQLVKSNTEVIRLQKLCDDNNIKRIIIPKVPNRAQRRQAEKVAKKTAKKEKK